MLNRLRTLHPEEQRVSWDQRIAAAQTLVALRQGSPAHDTLHELVKVDLDADDVSDSFSNLLLLVTLGDL